MTNQAERRANYRAFIPLSTRWADNDIYGHVNNVAYYSYFDTAANYYLIHEGGLDIENGPVIGFVVSSGCNYRQAITYPDQLEIGLRVDRIGNSSVQYGLAVFREGKDLASADGHFVHVFVDRVNQKPVPIPSGIRSALQAIMPEQTQTED